MNHSVTKDSTSSTQLRIKMLGGFELSYKDTTVGDHLNRSNQIWNALEYLIAHRNRSISNDELAEALWPNEESDNPANALKNLIYRIRTILAESGIPYAKDLIQYRRGSYGWNKEIDCWIDCDVFENLAKKAATSTLNEQSRIEYYLEALQLYTGIFLPRSYYKDWVIPISTYYHSLYFKCVQDVISLLQDAKRYEDIVSVCEAALVIDQFMESTHEALIDAWIRLGRQQQAISHYEYITDLFYRELGVRLSESMRTLYREIIKNSNHAQTDLVIIKEDLREASELKGAFLCEYEIFKSIYRLEARTAARTGQAVFIGLLTLSQRDGAIPQPKQLNEGMSKLLEVITSSLRRGDVISRFSATQYVLMLPTLTFENGQMVLERIAKSYRKQYPNNSLVLHTKLQPLDPIL